MFVGRGMASGGRTRDDDAIVDDIALAELEEEFVEEERSDIMRETSSQTKSHCSRSNTAIALFHLSRVITN